VPMEKVSLSLEADVVAEARAEAGGNLSAYVNEALEARMRNRHLRRVLDEFRHEFPPLDPEEDAQVRREFDEALEKALAGAAATEETMIRGTELLNEHPMVEEALITRGPLRLPVAYVALADEQKPVAEVFAELDEYLTQRLTTGRKVQFVLVGKDPHGRGSLTPVVP
jgi:Post-segregation antitoxin CcdA